MAKEHNPLPLWENDTLKVFIKQMLTHYTQVRKPELWGRGSRVGSYWAVCLHLPLSMKSFCCSICQKGIPPHNFWHIEDLDLDYMGADVIIKYSACLALRFWVGLLWCSSVAKFGSVTWECSINLCLSEMGISTKCWVFSTPHFEISWNSVTSF